MITHPVNSHLFPQLPRCWLALRQTDVILLESP